MYQQTSTKINRIKPTATHNDNNIRPMCLNEQLNELEKEIDKSELLNFGS